ncbi:hypothetical protein QP305_05460 [Actinotignum timonense]|nr:hypothetical protein [Actinotignum timonense]MDK6927189.1 hypothetical protein [Actinotignum timonense]
MPFRGIPRRGGDGATTTAQLAGAAPPRAIGPGPGTVGTPQLRKFAPW